MSLLLTRITNMFPLFCAAISVSHLFKSPATRERLLAFRRLDPAIRSFKANTQDSQEVSSGSVTMSSKYPCLYVIKWLNKNKIRILICFACVGAGKSSRSASKFSVTDLDTVRSSKRKPAASPTVTIPKAPISKGKGGKKRKTSEADNLQGLPLLRHQFLEYFNEVRITDLA